MRLLTWCDRHRGALLGLAAILTLAAVGMTVAPDQRLDPPAIAATGDTIEAPPATSTSTTVTLVDVRQLDPPAAWPSAPAERLGNAIEVPPATFPPAGVAGDCSTWRPLLEWFGIPFDEARPVMWRESRCDGYAFNGNASTGDESYGLMQVNRYRGLGDWWDSGGFTVEVMRTPTGSIAAAATLWHACGWGPWIKPYGCRDYQAVPSPSWADWQPDEVRP